MGSGMFLPIIAAAAAVTNIVSTHSMLIKKRDQLAETSLKCEEEKNESAERLVSTKIDVLSTLLDQHLAHQNLKRSVILVILFYVSN